MNRTKELAKWSEEDLEVLREKYQVMDTNELATLLGRSRNSVVIKANRIGIQKPKHAQNDSYFECIDDSTKLDRKHIIFVNYYSEKLPA